MREYDKIMKEQLQKGIIEEVKTQFGDNELPQKFRVITAYSSSKIVENLSKYNIKVINKPFEDLNATIELLMDLNE